ncbi:MAG: GNAT family N-acetyltransferase [Bacilli bacterium]
MEIIKGKNKFAILSEDHSLMGEISYDIDPDGVMVAQRTYVDHEYRGLGLARILVDTLVAEARRRGIKIVPCCSYVYKIFVENVEYADIWDKNSKKQQITCSL